MVGGLTASSAMLSPVVQTVLQMGFEASLVESLVQTKYLLTGQHYTSVSDLVTDVLQAEQEDRQRVPQSRGKSQWWKETWLKYGPNLRYSNISLHTRNIYHTYNITLHWLFTETTYDELVKKKTLLKIKPAVSNTFGWWSLNRKPIDLGPLSHFMCKRR